MDEETEERGIIMSSRNFKVCDWCKKEEETNYPFNKCADWKNIKIEFGQYNARTFDLCPNCLEKLGVLKEDKKEISLKEPETSEKLFEIIAEMVNNSIESR